MAIVDSKGGIRGKAGSVIYRMYRGKNIIQGIPKQFNLTQASKESASEFGMSSSCGRCIREAFRPLYREHYDGGMINRLSSAIYRSIRGSKTKGRGERDLHDGDLSLLEGLEFNQNSPFSQTLRVKPATSRNEKGQVVVTLPAITAVTDLVLPVKWLNPVKYRLNFLLVAINYREKFFEYIGAKELDMEQTTVMEAQELVFEGEVPQGCMLLLMASVTRLTYNLYECRYESQNSKEFCPAALIAAFQSQDQASEGYGLQRVRAAYTRAQIDGTPLKTLPISGYYGLDVTKTFRRQKRRQAKPPLKASRAVPEGLTILMGKRVKF